jgi:hypothetical protein
LNPTLKKESVANPLLQFFCARPIFFPLSFLTSTTTSWLILSSHAILSPMWLTARAHLSSPTFSQPTQGRLSLCRSCARPGSAACRAPSPARFPHPALPVLWTDNRIPWLPRTQVGGGCYLQIFPKQVLTEIGRIPSSISTNSVPSRLH